MKVAVTSGDPTGVGPEIIEGVLALNQGYHEKIIIVGESNWCSRLSEIYGVAFRPIESKKPFTLGEPCIEAAALAIEAMEKASAMCLADESMSVATGPISKYWAVQAGYSFPGQTEFFGDRWNGNPVMGFVGEKLTVVLVTWHIPLHEVSQAINPKNLTASIRAAEQLGKNLWDKEPRIGICGLNPHAGEEGVLGREEIDIIEPILNTLRNETNQISQPLPADTLFHRQLKGDFDVVVAMYHDQGLCPLKAVDFENAVNVTLGLPYVRTSPDHGTAFDIAGKGVASYKSMQRAIDLALKFKG